MYAVVSSGGKQYRVEPGVTLTMERLAAEAGEAYTFDRVLLIGDGDEVMVGTPLVAGATVSATVLGEELGPKLIIFKFKQKVKYRRRTGHRQHLVRVRIEAINADGRSTPAPPSEPPIQAEKPKARRASRAAKPAADGGETAAAEQPAEKPRPKPRARRKPAAAEAKAETAEASAPEEKPKPKRASRAKPKSKKPAATGADEAQEQ
jgi:large subunit ribosomal protein L21